MVEGIEGIGEAVTGGMIANAVEPEAGSARERHGDTCPNCGATRHGEYCHRCGQAAHIHRTLGAFWHDIAHSVFHFDGKIWRTLPMLAWHPGQLTRRYVEGERAKFVSPMALFLFSVFLMFATISTLGGPFHINSTVEDRIEAQQEYRQERAETLKGLQDLRTERARLIAARQATTEVDSEIRATETALAVQEKLFKQAMALSAEEEKNETVLKKAADGEVAPKGGMKVGFRTGIPAIDRGLDKANANPSLLLYKLQSNAYKFSWALIPISVPFLWLLFLHRRRYWKYKAYDHIVFVTYSIAFMSLGFIALTLLRPLGVPEAVAGTAIALGPPIHMYRQLRGAYQLSRFSALWRTAMLLIFALVAATLFFMLLLTAGALG